MLPVQAPKVSFQKMESDKKREYREQINEVEHDSFTLLIFSTCGGIGQEASVVVKKLADVLATKCNEVRAMLLVGCGAVWLSHWQGQLSGVHTDRAPFDAGCIARHLVQAEARREWA